MQIGSVVFLLWIAEEAALVGLIVLLFVFPILVSNEKCIFLISFHGKFGEYLIIYLFLKMCILQFLGISEEKSDEN